MKKSSCMAVGSGVSRRLNSLMAIACGVLISGFGIGVARSQGAAQDEVRSGPTASDKAAADEATVVYRHARPANTAEGNCDGARRFTLGVSGCGGGYCNSR